MFLLKTCIGPFNRAWLIPPAINLSVGSPGLGTPSLVSVQPGTYSGSSPGLVNFPIPNYNTFTITLRAAGGGGGATQERVPVNQYPSNGEASQFSLPGTPIIANGGLAGSTTGGGVPPAQGGSGGTVTIGGGGAG